MQTILPPAECFDQCSVSDMSGQTIGAALSHRAALWSDLQGCNVRLRRCAAWAIERERNAE